MPSRQREMALEVIEFKPISVRCVAFEKIYVNGLLK